MALGMFDWIGDFFKALFNLIPKVVYLLYASLACVIDILQLFFRKLAGLDVYYVDGVAQTGDLVTNFIGGILGINFNTVKNTHPYPMLTNVFWAMMLFGVIICFVAMFVAIIKSHYSYDGKTTPKQILMTGGKAIINMFAVPIIVLLGLFVSQALLTALDSITSVSSGTVVAAFGSNIDKFIATDTVQTATGKSNERTYLYYDVFGFGGAINYGDVSEEVKAWTSDDIKGFALIGAKNQSFSGSLFRVAAYNANRVRLGQYTKSGSDFAGKENLFSNAKDDVALADLVDMAFCNNMHLKEGMVLQNFTRWDSKKYFTNFTVSYVSNFSKFNVGAVWYYYDLWQFNIIVGFAGCIVCSSIFINIILGLMTRLIMCVVLFLIAPPLFGLAPIKDAAKGWRENFVKQALMAYGSVVGMNLVMMILPYLNDIDFFNIPLVDALVQTLFIIVGLISIKAVIETVSGLVGGADANTAGEKIAGDVGSTALKAGGMALGAAKVGNKAGQATLSGLKAMGNTGLAGANKISQKIAEGKAGQARDAAGKLQNDMDNARANKKAVENASDAQLKAVQSNILSGGSRDDVVDELVNGRHGKKMDRNDAERLYDSMKNANGGLGGKDGNSKVNGMSADNLRKTLQKQEAHNYVQANSRRREEQARAGKFEKKAAVKGAAAGARIHRAGKNTGDTFKFAGQTVTGFGSQMKSNFGSTYISGNKFGGAFTDAMKKSKDKENEKKAKKAEEEYKDSVAKSLAQIAENTNKSDGDK